MTSDIEALTILFQDGLINMAVQGLTLVIIIAVLYATSPLLATVMLVTTVPLMLASTIWFRNASDRGYAHIGIPETHHSISHHGNDAEKLAKYAKLCTYQIVKFGEFLDKLKSTKDADGTLLDHSLLYWGSGMSNGNAHDRSNPPAVLVGGAHGRLKGDRHIEAKKEEPTANLLLAMAQMAGAEVESLGASTGRLDL